MDKKDKKTLPRESTGTRSGAAILSEDEIRREKEHYEHSAGPDGEPGHLNDKELRHAGPQAPGTQWPHDKPFDIGDSLVEAEAGNASTDTSRTEQAAGRTLGKKTRDLESEVDRNADEKPENDRDLKTSG